MAKRDSKRAETIRSLISQGLTTAAIVRATGAARSTVSHYRKQASGAQAQAASTGGDVVALELLRGAASRGDMRAILRLQELQHERPCVDHIDKKEHEAALEAVYVIAEQNLMPISRLAKFVEVQDELQEELFRGIHGIRRTYQARQEVRDQLAGVVETTHDSQ